MTHSPNPSVLMSTKCIEIEEKFTVDNLDLLFSKLESLGFTRENEGIKFMDSYYDVLGEWHLCQSDCWLRFRNLGWETETKGSWQLKKGRRKEMGSSSTTVYEEYENDESFRMIETIFPTVRTQPFKSDEVESITEHGRDQVLEPFARIRSFRSSWKNSEAWNNVVVDIDSTDFGHTVGEVEIVLDQYEDEEEIKKAQVKIEQLVQVLTGEQKTERVRPVGKLEAFVMTHRPEVYDVCVRCGIMQAKQE